MEVWCCSLLSLKSGSIGSGNTASELIGDLKELEGKGQALKEDLWLAPGLREKLN